MRLFFLAATVFLAACQSAQEKDSLILRDRIQKLQPLSDWHPQKCDVHTQLSASQAKVYRKAYPAEGSLIDNWNVTYDWTAFRSRCEVHAQPLTPVTANQRAFLDEALCTLMQVFWVHSPFDDLKVLPTDVLDEDDSIFLRQKPDTPVGIYVDKNQMRIETKTSHSGTYTATYAQHGSVWLPQELRHQTATFTFLLKDFEWAENDPRTPPKSFWIYVGEMQAPPTAHTGVQVKECQPL